MGDTLVDMTGQRVGRLTVLGRGEDYILRSGKRRARWECVCDCGTLTLVVGQNLRSNGATLPTSSCGCLPRDLMASVGRQNWRGDDISYNTAHKRVRRARGRAKTHLCVGCGEAAAEWSYNHTDPDERTEPVHRPTGILWFAYSPDPSQYSPRCKPCHQRFDLGHERP